MNDARSLRLSTNWVQQARGGTTPVLYVAGTWYGSDESRCRRRVGGTRDEQTTRYRSYCTRARVSRQRLCGRLGHLWFDSSDHIIGGRYRYVPYKYSTYGTVRTGYGCTRCTSTVYAVLVHHRYSTSTSSSTQYVMSLYRNRYWYLYLALDGANDVTRDTQLSKRSLNVPQLSL